LLEHQKLNFILRKGFEKAILKLVQYQKNNTMDSHAKFAKARFKILPQGNLETIG